jgi:hypothetical protein
VARQRRLPNIFVRHLDILIIASVKEGNIDAAIPIDDKAGKQQSAPGGQSIRIHQ